MEHQEKRWKNILPFCLILTALVWAGVRWGGPIVELVSDPVAFREWVDARGLWGQAAMILIVAVQILVALIPGEPFEFAAGYAFGVWQGLLLCLAGSFIGGSLAMLLARRFGMRLVKALFPKQDIENLAIFRKPDRLRLLTFILFLIPGTPKDALTYIAPLAPIAGWKYLLIATFARIPSVVTSTILGDSIKNGDYTLAVIVFLVTALISAAGFILGSLYVKKKGKGE